MLLNQLYGISEVFLILLGILYNIMRLCSPVNNIGVSRLVLSFNKFLLWICKEGLRVDQK